MQILFKDGPCPKLPMQTCSLVHTFPSTSSTNYTAPVTMTALHDDEKRHDLTDVDVEAMDSDQDSTTQAIKALVAEDHDHDIKLRTMSWQRAAWLLAGDQVCLAIMAQSWSLSYVLLYLSLSTPF
jgi:hypothetical protein